MYQAQDFFKCAGFASSNNFALKMLHLQIVFQKVNYRHLFPSPYDNRLPLESVQLRTTQTFVDM